MTAPMPTIRATSRRRSSVSGSALGGDVLGVLRRHEVVSPLLGLVQEVHEFDGPALARLEGPAVGPHHRPEGDVDEFVLASLREFGLVRAFKDHAKMDAWRASTT